jgi:hypothetical protein
MRRELKLLLGPLTVALLAIGLIVAPTATAAPSASAVKNCVRANDIEAIVDDSISMEFSDESRLRVQAMNLLIDALNPKTQLGAIEFGSEGFERPAAETLFPPQPIGPNASAMKTILDQRTKADNGATDYNAAFAKADADNPDADARIFLTDGGHVVGTYNDAHLAHKVPTYVIGFGTGLSSGTDQDRLKKIAKDTGGKYFPLQDASQLQAVMNSAVAALTCQTPPRQFVDTLANGQSKAHSLAIGAATKQLQITLSWANALDKFKLIGLRIVGPNGPVAVASRAAKLKVTKTSSATFVILKVSRVKKGTLRFKVKAKKVGSGAKATVTTQVSQSRRR